MQYGNIYQILGIQVKIKERLPRYVAREITRQSTYELQTFALRWFSPVLSSRSVRAIEKAGGRPAIPDPGRQPTDREPGTESLSHLTDRCSTSGHESFLSSSPYILNRILNIQAKLEVSCFKRFGLDLPLKPDENTQRSMIWKKYHPLAPKYREIKLVYIPSNSLNTS